jgi:phage/plasmid-like protein (TIGR03299 family)
MKPIAFDVLTKQYSSFALGEPNKFSQTIERPVTWADARKLAGLTFTVSKRRLMHPNGFGPIDAWGIFRDDNDVFLATVGSVYTPVQSEYAFNFCDTLIGDLGASHYESAGVLGKGEAFWVLLRCPSCDFFINGTEEFNKCHLLFSSSHDGSAAAEARLTHVNVKRGVSLQTALRYGSKDALHIKHTTNAEKKLNAAKSLMSQVVLSSHDIQAKLNILAERKITKESLCNSLDRIFPGDQSTRRDNLLMRIISLFDQDNLVPAVKGTAYALLQAVNTFVDHEKGVRATAKKKGLSVEALRAESAIFGSGNDIKESALGVLLDETDPAHVS